MDEIEVSSKDLSDFFATISIGKKIIKEQKESLIGDSFDYFLSELTKSEKPVVKKTKKKKNIIEDDTIKEDIVPETPKNNYPSLLNSLNEANFVDPPSTKNSDPLTPLNQKFATLDDLERHYKLFLNRIQQQLSTLGGGGETNLTYMDVPITSVTTSSYTIKPQDYYIGVNYSGAVTITLPKADRQGKIFVVKDELGEASKGTNRHITILPTGSDLIDGRDKAILAYDYGSLTFIWKGNSWRVI